MRGRYSAFGFILLANIMLLVHTLIPHHHHKGVVCFTETHTSNKCDSEEHNQSCAANHSSEKEDAGCCVVKQDFLIPSDKIEKSTRCIINEVNSNFSNWFVAILFSRIEFNPIPNLKFKIQFFNFSILYSCYVFQDIALRAPPVL